MHQVHTGQEVLDFVGLDVTNHVPPNVLWQPHCFADQFLHAVLPEVALACVVGGLEVFVGFGLADGDQVHVVAGFLGALVHLGLHGEQVVLHGMTVRHGAALNSWMNKALRILGSTHVLLGGRVPPASATARMSENGMG